MRRLLPGGVEEPLEDLYLDLWDEVDVPAERPFVALGMVASVDGAVTVGGRSGALGGEADRRAFRRLREQADAILVGAGTVRAEGYGLPAVSAVERRRDRGGPPVPGLVIVTATGHLDPDSPLFDEPDRRPVVVAPEETDLAALGDRADVIRVGRERVALGAALRLLRRRGVSRLLCEGGPELAGQLVAADLVDEVALTVAPMLVGGGRRMLPLPVGPRSLALLAVREHAGELLLRYRVLPAS